MVWHPELVFQNMEKLVTVSIYGSDEKYKIWYGDDQKEVQFYQTIQVVFPTLVSKNGQIFKEKLANSLSWQHYIIQYIFRLHLPVTLVLKLFHLMTIFVIWILALLPLCLNS